MNKAVEFESVNYCWFEMDWSVMFEAVYLWNQTVDVVLPRLREIQYELSMRDGPSWPVRVKRPQFHSESK